MGNQSGVAMKKGSKIRIGRAFKPDPAYKKAVFVSLTPLMVFVVFFSLVAYWVLSGFSSAFGEMFSLIPLAFLVPSYFPLVVFYQVSLLVSPFAVDTLLIVVLVVDFFVVVLVGLYANAYVNSLTYKLDKSEVEWTRGVIGRYTGVVPYEQITNVDVVQGPVSRMFGIGSVKIQTAGYSGEVRPEISIDGIRDFDAVKGLIMQRVKAERK